MEEEIVAQHGRADAREPVARINACFRHEDKNKNEDYQRLAATTTERQRTAQNLKKRLHGWAKEGFHGLGRREEEEGLLH